MKAWTWLKPCRERERGGGERVRLVSVKEASFGVARSVQFDLVIWISGGDGGGGG